MRQGVLECTHYTIKWNTATLWQRKFLNLGLGFLMLRPTFEKIDVFMHDNLQLLIFQESSILNFICLVFFLGFWETFFVF
jgi:hypothetical protein